MRSFPIRFEFREKHYAAQVHRQADAYLVWITDTDLVRDFGGLVEISLDFTSLSHPNHPVNSNIKDLNTFHHTVINELRRA